MTRVVVALLLVVGPGNLRADEKTDQLQAQLDKAKKELESLQKKNAELEEKLVAAILELEKAKKEAVRLANEAKLAKAIAEDNEKKVKELLVGLQPLRVLGLLPQAPLPRQPVPLPEGTRGVVTDVVGELVTVDIGIDVGLGVGTVLDLYRLGDEKRYLGTVKVTSALNLFPKQAIVTFTPARNVPLDKLRPEELPKKGDEVRPQATKP